MHEPFSAADPPSPVAGGGVLGRAQRSGLPAPTGFPDPVGAWPVADSRLGGDGVSSSLGDSVRQTVLRAVFERAPERRARGASRFGTGDGAAALDAPSPELLDALSALRTAVDRCVTARRDQGVAVERVLREVKELVRSAESCDGWIDPSDLLMARVVRWSIAAFYGETGR